jgi:hypothetical protein
LQVNIFCLVIIQCKSNVSLQAAGDYFRRADQLKYAREAFIKLGDSRALLQVHNFALSHTYLVYSWCSLQLHIDACQWPEALALAAAAETDVKAKIATATSVQVGPLEFRKGIVSIDVVEQGGQPGQTLPVPPALAKELESAQVRQILN